MVNKLGKESGLQLPLMGSEIWAALLHSVPTVTRFLGKPEQGAVNLKLSYRGALDWLAVAKRYGDDGTLEVCFGSGPDAVGCLLGLENAMDGNKWRPDKYAR